MLLLGRTCCWPGADLAAPPPPLAPPRPPPSRWDWLRVREVERGLATCRLEMLELLLISLLDTHTRGEAASHIAYMSAADLPRSPGWALAPAASRPLLDTLGPTPHS